MWAGVGYVAQYAVTFVFTVVTARLLSPSIFGLMGLAVVVIAVGTLFADTGTQAALVHREERLDEAVNTALVSVPLSGLAAAGLGVASAPLLAWFYDDSDVLAVTAILSGVLFVRALGLVPDALLQRRLAFKWRKAVVDPLAALVGGVTATVAALLGAGVWALVLQWYAITATTTLGSWLLVRYRPNLGKASFRTWRELASYGRGIFGAQGVQLAYGYIDTLAIGRNMSTANVGWYGAATRLAIMPISGITHVAGTALFPAFARMREDLARLRAAYLEALRYISLLTVPVCIALAAVGEPLVVTLFGPEWRPTGDVVAVMMLWAIPYSVFETTGEMLKGIGRTGLIFRLTVIKFVVFAGYVAVVWALGGIGLLIVAGGLSVAMVAAVAVEVRMIRGVAGVTGFQFWRAIRPATVGGVVMAAVLVPLVKLGLPDLDRWHHIGSIPTGPLVPLVVMGLVAALGALLFAAAAEVVDPGSARGLLRQGRSVLRGRGGEEEPPAAGVESAEGAEADEDRHPVPVGRS
jgi:O-antigen/teichoic acid export membrane protein